MTCLSRIQRFCKHYRVQFRSSFPSYRCADIRCRTLFPYVIYWNAKDMQVI